MAQFSGWKIPKCSSRLLCKKKVELRLLNEDLGLWVRLLALFPLPTTNRKAPPPGNRVFPWRRLLPRLSCPAGFTQLYSQVGGVRGRNGSLRSLQIGSAAYDNCIKALQWVSSHAVGGGDFERDLWLDLQADFSEVYLLGDSAGANIAHHVLLRCGGVEAVLKLGGAIFLQLYFGAEQRTRSENECPPDACLTLQLSDAGWRLSLPLDSDRDHPFSNPWSPAAPKLEEVPLPPLMVAIGGRDML